MGRARGGDRECLIKGDRSTHQRYSFVLEEEATGVLQDIQPVDSFVIAGDIQVDGLIETSGHDHGFVALFEQSFGVQDLLLVMNDMEAFTHPHEIRHQHATIQPGFRDQGSLAAQILWIKDLGIVRQLTQGHRSTDGCRPASHDGDPIQGGIRQVKFRRHAQFAGFLDDGGLHRGNLKRGIELLFQTSCHTMVVRTHITTDAAQGIGG